MRNERIREQELQPESNPLAYFWNLTPYWNRRFKINSNFNIHVAKVPVKVLTSQIAVVSFYYGNYDINKIMKFMFEEDRNPAEIWHVTNAGARITMKGDFFTSPVLDELIHQRYLLRGSEDPLKEERRLGISLARYVQEQLQEAGIKTKRKQFIHRIERFIEPNLQHQNLIDTLGFDPGGEYKIKPIE